jgi:CDP-diacylglycerol---serine O-phosphatidyltransferase
LNRSAASFKLRFLVVNSFTGGNLLIGVLALFAVGTGATSLAAWGLLLCVLLDACDGSLARRWDVTSEFGAQLDSLADMTSFVIATATLAYYWVAPETPLHLIALASGLYALSGAIRLARFNCSTPNSAYFQGMPTTIVAAVLAAYYLIYPTLPSTIVVALVVLLAVLMISLMPYPKLSLLLRICPLWLKVVIVAIAALNPAWIVWFFTPAYIATGPGIWLYRKLDNGSIRL